MHKPRTADPHSIMGRVANKAKKMCARCSDIPCTPGDKFCGACKAGAVREAKAIAKREASLRMTTDKPRTIAARSAEQRGRTRLNLALVDDPSEAPEPMQPESSVITDEDAPGPLIVMQPVRKPDDPWEDA